MRAALFFMVAFVFAVFSNVAAEKEVRCNEPIVPGNCRVFNLSYGYNAKSNQCIEFIYGGCGGNENRFSSRSECEKACKE